MLVSIMCIIIVEKKNVSMPDPSAHGYVLKDDMFVPKWLSKAFTFNVAEFRQTCKCKTAKFGTCVKLGISNLPQCLLNRECINWLVICPE